MTELPHHPQTVRTELSLKLPAHLLRGMSRLVEKVLPMPSPRDDVAVHRIEVPSREPDRTILVDVYEGRASGFKSWPSNPTDKARTGKPVPVHISMHGSGFVTPNLGQDNAFTSWLAAQPAFRAEGGVVLDCDYRKAPEHPFPAPVEDVEDVVRFVWSQPHIYDRTRITLGGFSAGANLAIGVAYSVSNGVAFPDEEGGKGLRVPIAAVCSAYPATDMRPEGARDTSREPLTKVASMASGAALPRGLTNYFTKAYLVDPEKDGFDKRASVVLCNQDELPRHILVAAGEADSLFPEAKQFIDKLQSEGHPDAHFLNVGGEGHGFDKFPRTLVTQLHTDALHVKVLETILRGWDDAKHAQNGDEASG